LGGTSARVRNKLTARAVAALSKPGRYSDGGGLYLRIDQRPDGRRCSWVFRFQWRRATREMGLGSYPQISLAEARKAMHAAASAAWDGQEPIAARVAVREAAAGKPTFGDAARALMAAKQSEWRNAKHRWQWRTTLETYAAPLWAMPVDEVDTEAVLAVLQPLWQSRPETASRLRGRIEAVLDAARAHGHIPRNEANPARWKGHLDKLLAKRGKLSRGHHAAMAYCEIPAFMARLRKREAIAAMALEFLILTAARSGEVLGARWQEIDWDGRLWAIPASRMKASREHRVPLSGRALAIIERLGDAETGDFVFPGQKASMPLSGMALEMVLRRMKIDAATVHGFRSSFRDWCGEETSFPRELAEAALAHVAGDATERAYRRGDALEKRRALMAAWAGYCEPKARGDMVRLTKKV
jgi:integrase